MTGSGETPDEAGGHDVDEMARLMELMAEDEKAILEEASRLTEAPGLERVDEFLQEEWRRGPRTTAGSARPSRTRVLAAGLITLAAAAVLLVVVRERPDPGSSSPETAPAGQTLSGNQWGAIYPPAYPGATIEAWSHVEWSGPDRGRYNLVITRASDGHELLRQEALEARRFDLSGLDTTDWGSEVWIMVQRLGDTSTDVLDTNLWRVRVASGQ